MRAGYKVGLYIKPHFLDFNERARINGELRDLSTPVTESDVVEWPFPDMPAGARKVLSDRSASVQFIQETGGVKVRISFVAEEEHSVEQQQEGWQAILNRFAKHVEGKKT